MAKMKRKNKETKRKNGDEILALQKENEEMNKKFVEGGPSVRSANPVERSFTTPHGPQNC